MKQVVTSRFALAIAAAATLVGSSAVAEPVSVEAVLEPQEQMKFELADGSNHFVLAAQRAGTFEGSGAFSGASVTEFGWHDVDPPYSGDPQGYLQLTTPDGDVAVLHWTVQAVFLESEDGPELFNNGMWKLVSGTGQFQGKSGVGSLILEPAGGPTKFILEGEVGDKPK